MREFFWPILVKPDASLEAQLSQKLQLDIQAITNGIIKNDEDILIEEARRLADLESERRKTAEGRATIYLTILGVLAPILAAIGPSAFNNKEGYFKSIVTLVMFFLAAAYLCRSGMWAFKTLKVAVVHRVDATDLVKIWNGPDRKAELARGLLKCVRLDRAATNDKVNAIRMTHEFGLRAFIVFIAALLVRTSWGPIADVLSSVF